VVAVPAAEEGGLNTVATQVTQPLYLMYRKPKSTGLYDQGLGFLWPKLPG
jgi:hypothetical protein